MKRRAKKVIRSFKKQDKGAKDERKTGKLRFHKLKLKLPFLTQNKM